MKPVISELDYRILCELVKNVSQFQYSNEVKHLAAELKNATVVKNHKIDPAVVRLNSHVTVEDAGTGKSMDIQIVLPPMANLKEKKISVLAQLSIALIGFRENDTISWEMPAGVKSLKILKVIQPSTA